MNVDFPGERKASSHGSEIRCHEADVDLTENLQEKVAAVLLPFSASSRRWGIRRPSASLICNLVITDGISPSTRPREEMKENIPPPYT